jgi:hypothetical protein
MPTPRDTQDDNFAPRTRDQGADEADVLLDVPMLKVDEIEVEVDDLLARVSLRAEVLDLLKLHVGADVELGKVALKIKGVEAQALLKVRLDNVAAIIDRVLTAVENNPELLEPVARGVGAGAEQIGRGAGEGVRELGRGTGAAAEHVDEAARDLGGRTHSQARGAAERIPRPRSGGDEPRRSGGDETVRRRLRARYDARRGRGRR